MPSEDARPLDYRNFVTKQKPLVVDGGGKSLSLVVFFGGLVAVIVILSVAICAIQGTL